MTVSVRDELFEVLEHTSRSFSLGIMGLDEPLRFQVCLGYLLCRVFDTYEDAGEIAVAPRMQCLDFSESLLNKVESAGKPFDAELARWDETHDFDRIWPERDKTHPWEIKLLKLGPKIWAEIAGFEPERRRAFRLSLMDMVLGMKTEISKRQSQPGVFRRTLAEVDEYCYWVAGTVGLFLTHLFRLESGFRSNAQQDAELERLGVGFGKCLQLVNIMKDFHPDWKEGRCFWPDLSFSAPHMGALPPIEQLKASFGILDQLFHRYRKEAAAYLRYLRPEQTSLRFFCEFPLRMADATLETGRQDLTWLAQGTTFKVDRTRTAEILEELSIELAGK